jgi:6-phosphogluconolactonase (cycloisomerase 2 family)
MLTRVIYLVPAFVVSAMIMGTLSCRTTGSGGSSNSATATATPGTGALAFVTNFNDGKVSSFTRNTSTGVLKRTAQTTAGAKKGPKGVVAAPSGSFLYVANNSDDNIYQFSVNPSTGVLSPLSTPSVSNGNNSGPDEIAINAAGTFLWVTGSNNGTVTTYSINGGTGLLTQGSKLTGFVHPLGIAVDSTNSIAYVADNGAGLVYSFSIGANGKLTQIGPPVLDLNGPGGTPGFIAIDPSATFIYVTDLNQGLLSVLQTTSGTLAFGTLVPSTSSGFIPFGIAYGTVNTVGNFLFTANQGDASMWSFFVAGPGSVNQPIAFGMTDNLSAPTGVVVDPQNAFLYTTNMNAGTVSQFQLTPACINAGGPCFVQSVATESPHNANSGPFGITLAQ